MHVCSERASKRALSSPHTNQTDLAGGRKGAADRELPFRSPFRDDVPHFGKVATSHASRVSTLAHFNAQQLRPLPRRACCHCDEQRGGGVGVAQIREPTCGRAARPPPAPARSAEEHPRCFSSARVRRTERRSMLPATHSRLARVLPPLPHGAAALGKPVRHAQAATRRRAAPAWFEPPRAQLVFSIYVCYSLVKPASASSRQNKHFLKRTVQ